jgi:hypothetical protein
LIERLRFASMLRWLELPISMNGNAALYPCMVSNERRHLQQQQALIEHQLLPTHELTVINIEQRWL